MQKSISYFIHPHTQTVKNKIPTVKISLSEYFCNHNFNISLSLRLQINDTEIILIISLLGNMWMLFWSGHIGLTPNTSTFTFMGVEIILLVSVFGKYSHAIFQF